MIIVTNFPLPVCEIYRSRGRIGKATHHFEIALGIGAPFNWHNDLFGIHCELVELFRDEGRFSDAQTHLEHAKLHVVNNIHHLGRATELQAEVWYGQRRLGEAKSEALRAIDIFNRLGVAKDVERCRKLLRDIEIEGAEHRGCPWSIQSQL